MCVFVMSAYQLTSRNHIHVGIVYKREHPNLFSYQLSLSTLQVLSSFVYLILANRSDVTEKLTNQLNYLNHLPNIIISIELILTQN